MTTAMKAHDRHAGPMRRKQIWWLAGGLAAAVALVLVAGLFWTNASTSSTTARPTNRIFADERAYVPTVEEYQTVLLEPVDGITVEAQAGASGGPPGALRCQIAVTAGLTLCTLQWEQLQGREPHLSGPR